MGLIMANPSTPSSAYERMLPVWRLIDDVLAGGARVRSRGVTYLPRYDAESDVEYSRRLASSPWRPEFKAALKNLSSKPFSQDVQVGPNTPDVIAGVMDDETKRRRGGLVDNIDTKGNSLTAFSRLFFHGAIAKGMRGILVDHPVVNGIMSVADVRSRNLRPYWVDVGAEDIIALYSVYMDGVETIAHVRIKECFVQRDGYSETFVSRIREFDRPMIQRDDGSWTLGPTVWRLFESRGAGWEMIGEGMVNRNGNYDIPFVVFWTGERLPDNEVQPPLLDLADMQIELYRSMSRKEEILTYAGSPMLAAVGIAAPDGDEVVRVGPKTILYAPPSATGGQTGWEYVTPDAAWGTEVRNDIESIIQDMKRLGMQPLTPKSGNVTATATSVESSMAHSQVQSWAGGLKDVLEQAMVYTTQWLRIADTVTVSVNTDFSVEPYAQAPLDALDKGRQRRDISRGTYWRGLQRFDVLPEDFDPEEEEAALADEEAEIAPEAQDEIVG